MTHPNPNAPTQPIPIQNPNILNTPIQLEVPLPNEPLAEHDYNVHQQEVIGLLSQLQSRGDAFLRSEELFRDSSNPTHPQHQMLQGWRTHAYHAERGQALAELGAMEDRIEDIATSSNTGGILRLLEQHAAAAAANLGRSEEHAQRMQVAAGEAGRTAVASFVEAGTVSAAHAAQPRHPGAPRRLRDQARDAGIRAGTNNRLSLTGESRGAARREARRLDARIHALDQVQKAADKVPVLSRFQSAVDAAAANRVNTNLQNAEDLLRPLDPYYRTVMDLHDRINQERHERVNRAHEAFARSEADFQLWTFGQDPYSADMADDIRSDLEEVQDILNELSRHDPARAGLHQQFVRMQYRLVSRELAADPNSTTGQYRARTQDKGIIVDSAGERVVLYDDGTSARLEPVRGGQSAVVRRDASGNRLPAKADDKPSLEVPRNTPRVDMQTAYERWDRARTPESAAILHREVNGQIHQYEQQLAGLEAQLDTINQQAQAANQVLRDPNADPAARGQATMALRQLQTNRNMTMRNLQQVHGQVNPLRYMEGYLRIGTEQQDRAELYMNEFGAMMFRDVRVNGQRGSWEIQSDGHATRI